MITRDRARMLKKSGLRITKKVSMLESLVGSNTRNYLVSLVTSSVNVPKKAVHESDAAASELP
jgi:hypothetical protein